MLHMEPHRPRRGVLAPAWGEILPREGGRDLSVRSRHSIRGVDQRPSEWRIAPRRVHGFELQRPHDQDQVDASSSDATGRDVLPLSAAITGRLIDSSDPKARWSVPPSSAPARRGGGAHRGRPTPPERSRGPGWVARSAAVTVGAPQPPAAPLPAARVGRRTRRPLHGGSGRARSPEPIRPFPLASWRRNARGAVDKRHPPPYRDTRRTGRAGGIG